MKRIEFEDALVVKPAKVSVLDEMPVGSVIDYEGDEVPEGWEEAGSDDYSTEEKFTGKYWIDGKRIYRKVVSVSNKEISSAASISTGITNLNELISLNGIYTNISGGTKTPYPLTQNTGTILNCVYYQGNIGFVGNETYSMATDRIHTFILEYTKTTE